jgi:acetolactate synthase-1/2/3 large subunit
MQRGRFDGHFVASTPESGLTLPDLEKISNAYGLPYVKISTPAALMEQVKKVFAMPGSVVCEVMIDPAIPSAPRLASRALPDGRMVSEPMENLAPFLPEEELAEILNAE